MTVLIKGTTEGSNDRFQYVIESNKITDPTIKQMIETKTRINGCPTLLDILEVAQIAPSSVPDRSVDFMLIDEYKEVAGQPVPVYKSW